MLREKVALCSHNSNERLPAEQLFTNWPILTPHTKEDSECPRQNWGKKSQQEHYQLRSFRKLGKAADFQVHVILAVLPSGQTVLTSFQTRYLERPFRCFD